MLFGACQGNDKTNEREVHYMYEAKAWKETDGPSLRGFNEKEAIDSVNGAFPSDVEVKHHSREYNKPPEGDGRDQLVGCFSCVAHIFVSPFSCFIFV